MTRTSFNNADESDHALTDRDPTQNPTSSSPRKADRRRELNIIYFVDANRTRSFKLSLNTAYALGAVFVVGVIWSIASVVLLYQGLATEAEQRHRIRGLLTTIFDYETRYDNVYEKAYPKSDSTVAAHGASHPEDTKPVESSASSPAEKPATTAQAEAPKSTTAEPAAAETTPSSASPRPAAERVSVGDVSFNPDVDSLKVRLAIRNRVSPKKLEGYVWGIATFEEEGGAKRYISAPTGVGVDATGLGTPETIEKAHHFSIRNYKAKSLVFARPAGVKGEFTSVRVFVASEDDLNDQITVPVQITDRLPTPETPPTPASETPPEAAPPSDTSPTDVQGSAAPVESPNSKPVDSAEVKKKAHSKLSIATPTGAESL